MSGDYTQRIIVLITILVAATFGVVLNSGFCSASPGAHEAIQCSAEFISNPTVMQSLAGDGALTTKTLSLAGAVFIVFASGLAQQIAYSRDNAQVRARKFHTLLPRSWPNLFPDEPANLTASGNL